MKVSKPQHKSILHRCFFMERDSIGGPRISQKSFDLSKLADATATFKKLESSLNEDKTFNEDPVEFTPTEVAILKEMFDQTIKEIATPDRADSIFELKDLFDGKE